MMNISNNVALALGDFILYKQDTYNQLGKIVSPIEDSKFLVERFTDEIESTGEEDVISPDMVICNLFKKPAYGSVYGKTFSIPPKKVKMDGHQVHLYFPKDMLEAEGGVDTTAYIDALQRAFDLVEPLRSSWVEKEYEIHIREGEPHKSSFKKSKKDFDGVLNLEIKFTAPDTIINAVVTVFSQSLWKSSTKESRSDWLKAFSDDLVYEKLNNSAFTEKFLTYISEDSKVELEQEDEIICKLLAKEIKRVKCVSLKELKLLAEVNGDDYITSQLLPEVINGVRLKDSVRINPLTGVTALKKFSSELTSYLINQRADSQFEPILKMFFDY